MVVSVVIGALGLTSKRLKDWQKKLDEKVAYRFCTKASLLGTAKVEWQVLET